jgi:hypothetical protein
MFWFTQATVPKAMDGQTEGAPAQTEAGSEGGQATGATMDDVVSMLKQDKADREKKEAEREKKEEARRLEEIASRNELKAMMGAYGGPLEKVEGEGDQGKLALKVKQHGETLNEYGKEIAELKEFKRQVLAGEVTLMKAAPAWTAMTPQQAAKPQTIRGSTAKKRAVRSATKERTYPLLGKRICYCQEARRQAPGKMRNLRTPQGVMLRTLVPSAPATAARRKVPEVLLSHSLGTE